MFDFYPHYEIWFARLQLICFMLGMGVNLALVDFIHVLRRPRSVIIGLVLQIGVIPVVAVGINWAFALEPAIALGLILAAAMPGGSLAKVFVFLGRGHAPLAIVLSALATLATLVSVPATLQLLAGDYVPADFVMPVADIMADVLLFLLAPAAAGMFLARCWPAQRRRVAIWAVRFGFLVVAVMITGSLGSGRIQPGEHGLLVAIAIVVFCLIGQQLCMAPYYLLRLPRGDRLAVGVEVTMRNMNLALLLKASLFQNRPELADGVLFVILFYAGVSMAAGTLLVLNHRRLAKRDRAAVIREANG